MIAWVNRSHRRASSGFGLVQKRTVGVGADPPNHEQMITYSICAGATCPAVAFPGRRIPPATRDYFTASEAFQSEYFCDPLPQT